MNFGQPNITIIFSWRTAKPFPAHHSLARISVERDRWRTAFIERTTGVGLEWWRQRGPSPVMGAGSLESGMDSGAGHHKAGKGLLQ